MDLGLNPAPPMIMHVDLNSAFAQIEQQANPLLRGKPIGMVNRAVPGGTIIAASHEAKLRGVGVGTKVQAARLAIPEIIILETDPPKYIHAHRVFKAILKSYSPEAYMKSIDEGVIDFNNVYLPPGKSLQSVAGDIKAELKESLGEWVTCNVGIAPSRWTAKLAASLHKPNGLDIIDQQNLRKVYSRLELMDLSGINRRYRVRLQLAGILTPLDFLTASEQKLTREVFHSVNGHHWYARLRGWEVDAQKFSTKTVGRQYVMHEPTNDLNKLAPILFKMCERLGRRLRAKGFCAQGVSVGCYLAPSETALPQARLPGRQAGLRPPRGDLFPTGLEPGGYWQARQKFSTQLFTTQEIFDKAFALLKTWPQATVKLLSVTTYGLSPAKTQQLPLFGTPQDKSWGLMEVVDSINNRYGELVLTPARMRGTEDFVTDKVPFGSTRHLDRLTSGS